MPHKSSLKILTIVRRAFKEKTTIVIFKQSKLNHITMTHKHWGHFNMSEKIHMKGLN